jgi:crotonobetainyl-CoA:carnitine CoA-transferase CaiB-like acyl-CoA transferase
VWEKLTAWMDEKGVGAELHDAKFQDEAFRTAEYRTGTVLRDAVARLIAASNGEECFHRAQSYGISWGLVHAAEENIDLPHYRQRGYWRPIEHPEIGRSIDYPRGPVDCEELAIAPRGRAPHLGEHTRQVLSQDLGLSDADIASLTASGAVR